MGNGMKWNEICTHSLTHSLSLTHYHSLTVSNSARRSFVRSFLLSQSVGQSLLLLLLLTYLSIFDIPLFRHLKQWLKTQNRSYG